MQYRVLWGEPVYYINIDQIRRNKKHKMYVPPPPLSPSEYVRVAQDIPDKKGERERRN